MIIQHTYILAKLEHYTHFAPDNTVNVPLLYITARHRNHRIYWLRVVRTGHVRYTYYLDHAGKSYEVSEREAAMYLSSEQNYRFKTKSYGKVR